MSRRIYRPADDPWSIPVIRMRTINELPRNYANRANLTISKLRGM